MKLKQFLHEVKFLYHFTDTRNLDSIRSTGGLYSLEQLRVREIRVPAPGGNALSNWLDEQKGLDHYVSLCLRRTHEMERKARKDGRIDVSLFLRVDSKVVTSPGILFAGDIANSSNVCIFSFERALENDCIDLRYLRQGAGVFDEEQIREFRRASRFEVLVPNHIPAEFILNLPNG